MLTLPGNALTHVRLRRLNGRQNQFPTAGCSSMVRAWFYVNRFRFHANSRSSAVARSIVDHSREISSNMFASFYSCGHGTYASGESIRERARPQKPNSLKRTAAVKSISHLHITIASAPRIYPHTRARPFTPPGYRPSAASGSEWKECETNTHVRINLLVCLKRRGTSATALERSWKSVEVCLTQATWFLLKVLHLKPLVHEAIRAAFNLTILTSTSMTKWSPIRCEIDEVVAVSLLRSKFSDYFIFTWKCYKNSHYQRLRVAISVCHDSTHLLFYKSTSDHS